MMLLLSRETLVPCAAGHRGGGKVGILSLDFHFSRARRFSFAWPWVWWARRRTRRRSCGNVGISRRWRDFQGLWKGWEACLWLSTLSIARHFHSSVCRVGASPLRGKGAFQLAAAQQFRLGLGHSLGILGVAQRADGSVQLLEADPLLQVLCRLRQRF